MKRMLVKTALMSLLFVSAVGSSSFAQEQTEKTAAEKKLDKRIEKVNLENFASNQEYGDYAPCVAVFKESTRNTFLSVDSSSFFSDSKSYFLSQEFKQHQQSGGWSGGISVITDKGPIGLKAGASSSDVDQFQRKIEKASSVRVEMMTYSNISTSVVDKDALEKFNECINNVNVGKYGVSISAEGETMVAVTIVFNRLSPDDKTPWITYADISGISDADKARLLNGLLKRGTSLKSRISFSVKRNPNEEFTLDINLSNGLAAVKRLIPEDNSMGNGLPIGTIIASTLDFNAFSKLTNNNPSSGVWSPSKSKWTPCDGRSITGSKYQTLWAGSIGSNAPDLRGVFLRGLNVFDPMEQKAVDPAQANPENKKRGEFQADELKSHNHKYKASATKAVSGQGSKSEFAWDPETYTTYSAGGAETRPKNVSVYYYIRIN